MLWVLTARLYTFSELRELMIEMRKFLFLFFIHTLDLMPFWAALELPFLSLTLQFTLKLS